MAPLALKLENGPLAPGPGVHPVICILVDDIVIKKCIVGIRRPMIWTSVLLATGQGVVAGPVVTRGVVGVTLVVDVLVVEGGLVLPVTVHGDAAEAAGGRLAGVAVSQTVCQLI
jgi:hypothetical protein